MLQNYYFFKIEICGNTNNNSSVKKKNLANLSFIKKKNIYVTTHPNNIVADSSYSFVKNI